MAKKTYQELLKENLSEFDTTKTVDVKGPMLDPILGYAGDGELPTYKDAASVLERYYFGEKKKEDEISEMDYENDKGDSSGESMKNTEGPEGEEQAGTSNANNPSASAKEKAKDIAKEGKQSKGKVVSEKEMNTPDLKSSNMKDAEGPEDEEQAGTGNTYSDFKKRVVEAIESISENDDEDEDDEDGGEEDEGEEKEKKGKAFPGAAPPFKKGMKEGEEKEGEEEEEEEEEGDEKEEMEEAQGVVPPGALRKKMKNEDSGEEYEDETDAKGVKEGGEFELSADDEDITESLENEIIEKLIAEMEEEGENLMEKDEEEEGAPEPEGDEGEEEEEEEEEEGLDVDKKMEEMVNRLTQGPSSGPEGEKQAGTTGKEGVIPPRKDRSNEGTKEKGTKPMDKSELADA